MNSKWFPFPHFVPFLPFFLLILLKSPAVSTAEEWSFNCQNSSTCRSIDEKKVLFWTDYGIRSCVYPDLKEVNCEGSNPTIEIFGANYKVLRFDSKDQILIMSKLDIPDEFCSLNRPKTPPSSIYAMIPVTNCRNNSQKPEETTCSETEFTYKPIENRTYNPHPPGYCMLSTIVPISASLLYKLDDNWQKVAENIAEEFTSGRKVVVTPQIRRRCRVLGYDLEFNRTTCYCNFLSDRFEGCPDPSNTEPPGSPTVAAPTTVPAIEKPSNLMKKISIIVTVVIGCIFSTISILVFIYYARRRILSEDKTEEIIETYSTRTPKRYSYSKLKKMTGSFKTKLGQGGFSTVYKGSLPDGREVAVKLLNELKENGHDFMNEVVSLSSTSHVNIATLLGFCYERNKKALVYEYMPKGSLEKYISYKDRRQLHRNEVKLDWITLYRIVIGIARGLEYLHRGCKTRILHFDIKPHNILLDNEFCPKISDFGLAKQCRTRESHVSMTGVKGTVGFMAPEVVFRNLGNVSHKSDVYSYGMLVLEMVGERNRPRGSSEEYFPDWIYAHLSGNVRDGDFQWGNREEEEEMVRKMIIVGLCCIQTLPEERPSMSDVVGMLEGSVNELRIPPKPALFGHRVLPQHQLSCVHNTTSFSCSSCLEAASQFGLIQHSQL